MKKTGNVFVKVNYKSLKHQLLLLAPEYAFDFFNAYKSIRLHKPNLTSSEMCIRV